MSKNYWLSPEDVIRKKKRNKYLLYISIMVGTMILSALVTILANKI